jgi:putative oxidoreductase
MNDSCNKYAGFISRLIVGAIFVFAGWAKVSDMTMTVSYFSQMGLSSFFAYIVSYAELLGGVALVLGLWTQLASLGLMIIMFGAIWYSRSMGIAGIMPVVAIIAALLGVVAHGDGMLALKFPKKSASQTP